MDILFAARWKRTDTKAQARGNDGTPPSRSGLYRLLAAVGIIAAVFSMVDHASRGGQVAAIAASAGPAQHWRWK